MKYSKLIKGYIGTLKKKAGYVLAETSEEKQSFINSGLNALYIAFKELECFTDFENLEKELTNFGYTKLSTVISKYKIRNAERYLSFNIGILF